MIRELDSTSASFSDQLNDLLSIGEEDRREIRRTVAAILEDVRTRGDASVIELTNRFDQRSVDNMNDLTLGRDQMEQAYAGLDPLVRDALNESAARVRRYHEEQLAALGSKDGWQYEDDFGNRLGQRVNAMQKVGIYTPGGKAAYPSTIVMTAVPASVAGVEEIVLCVPMPGGEVNDVLLAAAWLADVDHVYAVGGAQAIAAMAFGTETISKVDKIVGPGNVYVATAKEMVFGRVGIDMIAGPSEVVIVCDDTSDPAWVIQDMFAQAEHDEMAQAIVITPSADLIERLRELLPQMLKKQQRKEIIEASISSRGGFVQVRDMAQAFDVVNRIAPEHLQLAFDDARNHVDRIRHAGAIFVGSATTEVVGDYSAGPSHVLPTSGTARFASPLGVYDFQTRSSLIQCSPEGAVQLNRAAAILAAEEGLDAHAESARSRVKG